MSLKKQITTSLFLITDFTATVYTNVLLTKCNHSKNMKKTGNLQILHSAVPFWSTARMDTKQCKAQVYKCFAIMY